MTNPDLLALANELDDIETDAAGKCNWSEVATVSSALRRLASSDGGVKVRELEWRGPVDAFPTTIWEAKTPFGHYVIEEVSASDSPAYEVRFAGGHVISVKDGLNDAKAAAQRYYEVRILSALIEVPAVKGEPEPVAWRDIIKQPDERPLPTYSQIPWAQLGRDVNDATFGRRADFEFSDKVYPGHQMVLGINFNSLARIVDKYRYYGLPCAAKPYAAPPADAWMREALDYAERLAVVLWSKHFKDSAPNWKPLTGDLIGLLTQIDSMTAALTAPGATTKSDSGVKGEPEPVAWQFRSENGKWIPCERPSQEEWRDEPEKFRRLYLAAPPADAGMREASIVTCCVTGAIPGDGGACGDCDPCLLGEASVPSPVKRLIAEKNSLLHRVGELEDKLATTKSDGGNEQYLHEVADGSWGDPPLIRAAARDRLAAIAAKKSDGSVKCSGFGECAAVNADGVLCPDDTCDYDTGVRKPGPSDPSSTRSEVTALADIAKERQRQRDIEGWTVAHDDGHDAGEMASAAACYALSATGLRGDDGAMLRFWPWNDHWWKPTNRRRDLIKAGALIVAEIERLDRLDRRK